MNKQRKVVITITYNEMGIIIDTKAEKVAQPDRNIPKKPGETTDRSWGIPHRLAVCPTCDSYLGIIHFIGEGGKLKVTFCESCGQAIDWEGWEEDGQVSADAMAEQLATTQKTILGWLGSGQRRIKELAAAYEKSQTNGRDQVFIKRKEKK